jgi:Periplasmic binding protein
MKRRDFLQVLGMGATIPALGVAAQAAPHKLRVLALAPKAFSSQFLRGLTQNQNLEIQYVDAGSTTTSAARAATQILERKTFDVLVSLGDGYSDVLRPILEQHALPAICNEFGAKIPQHLETSAFVLSNSLKLWQSEWALGVHAAQQRKANIGRGNTAVMVCTLREAGYDLPFAFQSGFESAGGTILETIILDASGKTDLHAVLEQIRSLKPAHIHVIASDATNLEMLRATRVPISASAMTEIQATTAFSSFERDVVMLLGQESAAILAQAANSDALNFLKALRTVKIQTARGTLEFARNQNQNSIQLEKNGTRRTLEPVSEMHPRLHTLRNNMRSGFTNTYMV